MIRFLFPARHDFTIRDYLSNAGRSVADRIRFLSYEELPAKSSFERGTYVLAGMEGLGPGPRRLLEEIHGQLSGVEGFRFLNHPTRTLRRFDLLAELRRRGLNAFGAARAGGDLSALRYPVFLRSEPRHSGAISPLLDSRRDVEAAVGRALLDGHRLNDLLVVEFCDTADADGFYRKYAAFVVGDRVLARSVDCGRAWMLKDSQSELSRARMEDEIEYVRGNPHERELAEIFRVAGIEYGRIDYAMKDGRVQTWEINLHPTIGPDPHPPRNPVPEELRPLRKESRRHFYEAFAEAWKAVDVPAQESDPISVSLDPETVRAARRPAAGPGLWRRAVRRIAGPAGAWIRPIHGAIGRRARSSAAGRTTP